jgi:hypothetical protein
MVTEQKIYTLKHDQLNGLDKLMFWSREKYTKSTSRREKRMWGGRLAFLSKLINQGTYIEDEKSSLNYLRTMYLNDKI